MKVLKKLAGSQFFKDATCAQFASFILSSNRLPEIGQVNPYPAHRGDVDRQGENRRLPEMKDGLTLKMFPKFDVAIQTAPVGEGQTQWALTLKRSVDVTPKEDPKLKAMGHLDTETVFLFSLVTKNNKPTCDLDKISYTATPRRAPGAEPMSQNFDTQGCLELFLNTAPAYASLPLGARELMFIKKDCAMGVHYFADAKVILARKQLGLKH